MSTQQLLPIVAAIAFLLGSGAGTVLLFVRVGYSVRGFVDAQTATAKAMQEIAAGFRGFAQQQTVFNERLQDAVQIQGGRLTDLEREIRGRAQ